MGQSPSHQTCPPLSSPVLGSPSWPGTVEEKAMEQSILELEASFSFIRQEDRISLFCQTMPVLHPCPRRLTAAPAPPAS
eukprot:1157374-Pelagomonas_calceolata.AAC.3